MNGLRQTIRILSATALLWALSLSAALALTPTSNPKLNLTAPTTVGKGFDTIDHVIVSGFNIVLTVAGVLFVLLFLLGGVQYLASAGNEEGTKKARQLLLDAVIGIGIVVTAWAVGTYVLQLLGLSSGGLRT